MPRASRTIWAKIAANPSRPSLMSTAYTVKARNRREFSVPMFMGLGTPGPSLVGRQAASLVK
ncbi:MAG: hypothetical protein SEPTF4163_003468 [Sporothrix epigloea]